MGELHLEILVDRMKREFKVEANVGKPQVAFRETSARRSPTSRGSSSGRAAARASTATWSSTSSPPSRAAASSSRTRSWAASFPASSSSRSRPGIREALENGVLAGYPMVDVKATLIFGSYHDVDSSEMAFKIAGSMAVKEAARQGAARCCSSR